MSRRAAMPPRHQERLPFACSAGGAPVCAAPGGSPAPRASSGHARAPVATGAHSRVRPTPATRSGCWLDSPERIQPALCPRPPPQSMFAHPRPQPPNHGTKMLILVEGTRQLRAPLLKAAAAQGRPLPAACSGLSRAALREGGGMQAPCFGPASIPGHLDPFPACNGCTQHPAVAEPCPQRHMRSPDAGPLACEHISK